MKLIHSDKEPVSEIKSALLIDDSEIDNYITARLLSKTNVINEIICKTSAEEALFFLNECLEKKLELPEIIFLDIRMPSMDGFEFLQEFAKLNNKAHTSCTIFMLSSSVDQRDIARAKRDPYVREFITKPICIEDLTNIIASYKISKSQAISKTG
jgi:CheY-like chemotaxis protein